MERVQENENNIILILIFISLINLGWICFFTFNPDFIKVKREWEIYPRKDADPDTLKCLIYATILSLLILVLLKVVKYFKDTYYY